jgi:hypothetical protein
VKEYSAMCTWVNDSYGWNIIMDEQNIKDEKKMEKQKKIGWIIKLDEHHLFTTKCYVPM